jgi:1-acyl-sn-glycerol-3-phosphate acyltransferase
MMQSEEPEADSSGSSWVGTSRVFYETVRRLVSFIVAVRLLRLRVEGSENIPSAGPVVLMSNHQSNLDAVLIPWGTTRPVSSPAKRELFENGVMHWILRAVGAFPIDRSRKDVGAIRSMLEILRRDGVVCVFPEMTRTRTGEVGSFQPALMRFAGLARAQVVPTAIEGSGAVLPRGRVIPRLRSSIVIRFAPPVDVVSPIGTKPSAEDAERLTGEVRATVEAMVREIRAQSSPSRVQPGRPESLPNRSSGGD